MFGDLYEVGIDISSISIWLVQKTFHPNEMKTVNKTSKNHFTTNLCNLINHSKFRFHTIRTTSRFTFQVGNSRFSSFDLNETFRTDGLLTTSGSVYVRWVILFGREKGVGVRGRCREGMSVRGRGKRGKKIWDHDGLRDEHSPRNK